MGLTGDEVSQQIMLGEEARLEVSSSSLGPRGKIDIVVGCESSRRDDADLQINVEGDTVISMSNVSLGETKSCHTDFVKELHPLLLGVYLLHTHFVKGTPPTAYNKADHFLMH